MAFCGDQKLYDENVWFHRQDSAKVYVRKHDISYPNKYIPSKYLDALNISNGCSEHD